MNITLSALATFIILTSLVACGGGDDGPSDDANGGAGADPTVNATSTSSTGSAGATPPPPSSGDRPSGAGEDFPVAIPEGWVIDVNGSIGLVITNQVQVLYPLDQFESVVAFYDQWTADQPEEYTKIESDDGIVYQLGTPLRQIGVDDDFERDGSRYVVLLITVTG